MKPKAIFLVKDAASKRNIDRVFDDKTARELRSILDLSETILTADDISGNPDLGREVEIILSSWGAPVFGSPLLTLLPNAKAVFYGAGTIKYFITPEFWKRGLRVFSAAAMNSIPVAEFTTSLIHLSLKQFFRCAQLTRERRDFSANSESTPGAFDTTIGIVSMGSIARLVVERLKETDLNFIVYDPYLSDENASNLGIKKVDLAELFQRSQVVSVHAPWLDSTVGMITGELINSMPRNATLINTARGAVINESEMLDALEKRPDITALLDVTWPEPPADDSRLFTLPNVILTPHIAGSLDKECHRMGKCMLEELKLYLAGASAHHEVTENQVALMA